MHNTKFNSPVLGEEVKNIYSIYGKNEECFINILECGPDEMAVISRMLAFLNMHINSKSEKNNSENDR